MTVFGWILVAANVAFGIATGSILSFGVAAFVAGTLFLTSDM